MVILTFVLVAGVALGLVVMVRGYSPVPFADFWTQFSFIERALEGEAGIADAWAQHNEHRIVGARLQFLADYGLFGGTNVFLFVSIAVSSLALAALYAVAVRADTRDRLLVFGTFSVAAASTMSAAGWENLTWAFQVQFVQVFLFGTLAILAVVLAARTSGTTRRGWLTALAAIAAVAATYSMGNGLLVWPVVVGLALALRLERRLTAIVSVVGVATTASYLWRLEFSARGELSDPVGLVTFVAVYLGSAVWGAGLRPAAFVGAVGLALAAGLLVVAWRRRTDAPVALSFGAGVAVFICLTASQTAVGRVYLGTSQALASRYSIASFTFWLALLVGFLVVVRERLPSRPSVPLVYLVCAAAVTLFVSFRTVPDHGFQQTTRFGREATVLAYRVGVSDFSQTVKGVAAGDAIDRAFRWMERHRLGPWAPGGMVERVQSVAVAGGGGRGGRPCAGAIESNEPVERGRRLRGWIQAPGGGAASRSLVVLDAAGGEVGLGLVGDLRAGTDERSGFVAYVRGSPTAPLSVVLLGSDRRAPVCRLRAR